MLEMLFVVFFPTVLSFFFTLLAPGALAPILTLCGLIGGGGAFFVLLSLFDKALRGSSGGIGVFVLGAMALVGAASCAGGAILGYYL